MTAGGQPRVVNLTMLPELFERMRTEWLIPQGWDAMQIPASEDEEESGTQPYVAVIPQTSHLAKFLRPGGGS